MTKTEARKILKEHNSWRRGDTPDNALPHRSAVIGEAIDELVKYPEIAAEIRDAAICKDTDLLSDFDLQILDSFCNTLEQISCFEGLAVNQYVYPVDSDESLTFMLFVAEALAS